MDKKKFIIWDRKDNYRPRTDEDGNITSAGVIGVVEEGNAYISIYGEMPDGSKPVSELKIGERSENVKFSLSGSSGLYDIYRVA
jgi:hypothetical protein